MNRPAGIPLVVWIGAIAAGIGGFAWFKKRSSGTPASPATATKTGQPGFSQAQEVQDFQVFSALTSAQQGSDLSFLTQMASLFAGGSSTGTTTNTPTTGVPSPTSTGTTSPATVPASTVAASSPVQTLPGYGAGLNQLQANNPNLAAATAGETVTYNGVPI